MGTYDFSRLTSGSGHGKSPTRIYRTPDRCPLLCSLTAKVEHRNCSKRGLRHWLGTLPSMRRAYITDLSDVEWAYLEAHLPSPQPYGRPRIQHSPREILNAIFYIVRSGCAWRLLPHDFPPWKTVHHYFRIWCIDGTWERLNAALRQRLRIRLGRNPQPSAGMVDSQSAKTIQGVGGEARGLE